MATTTITTALHAITRMFSQRPSRIAGNEAVATSQLKNDALTRGHPGDETSASQATATRETVDTAATLVARAVLTQRVDGRRDGGCPGVVLGEPDAELVTAGAVRELAEHDPAVQLR